VFPNSLGKLSEKYTFMVNKSSRLETISLLDDESEYILLSVRSNLLKISLATRLSNISPRITPEEKIKNEFLFFVSIG
jgi:hypothetical protein